MLLEILGFINLSLTDIIDILLVAFILYFGYRWIKDSSAFNIFIAIVLMVIFKLIVDSLGMKMMSSLMGTVIDVGVLALIIIFQPEIRHFLTRIGARSRLFAIKDKHLADKDITEIVEACMAMSKEKTGALIVFPHTTPMEGVLIDSGDNIDALVHRRLIMNLFFKNSPLHDGAMIISEGRIVSARCTLPMTKRTDIPPHYGTRHKAAIGMSEESDATVLVVSEETGTISIVRDGKINSVQGVNELMNILMNDRRETRK